MKKLGVIIITVVSFIIFFIEALLHYNIGRGSTKFVFPTKAELGKIVAILLVFSLITGLLSEYILEYYQQMFSL